MSYKTEKTNTRRLLVGQNDLKTKFPHIANEWHQNLNSDLKPNQIAAHTDKKVWWLCKKCGEAYFTSVYSRTSLNTGCPICKNRKIVVGLNDLATTHPKIAQDWNYSKNGNLKPIDIVAGSNRKVWWICSKGHEWRTAVCDRKSGKGCPICAREKRPLERQKTYLTKNGSLSDNYPEIALQWHPTKNGDLSPSEITAGSSKLVWWICEKGHEWEAVVYSRVAGRGCPYCNNEHGTSFPEQALYYYLSQVTKAINRYSLCGKEIDIFLPDLNIGIEYNGRYYHQVREEKDAEKYEYFRNLGVRVIVVREGDLSFVDGDNVYYQYKNSDYFNMKDTVCRVIELCSLSPVDVDIKRDQAKIYEQYMEQEKANSLVVKYPWLIEEWDYKENGKLTPWQVSYGSKKRIHWICKKCGYKWDAVAHTRKKSGCPCCANRVVVEGINDLCTTHPDLAKEWDYRENGKLTPWQVSYGSKKRIHWICKKCGYKWDAEAHTRKKNGCPCCANRVVVEGVNDLCTTHPDLAKEWDYQKNEKMPSEVVAGSHQYAWWLCEKKHSWRAQIKSRAKGCGCPECANKKFE